MTVTELPFPSSMTARISVRKPRGRIGVRRTAQKFHGNGAFGRMLAGQIDVAHAAAAEVTEEIVAGLKGAGVRELISREVSSALEQIAQRPSADSTARA